MKSNIKKFNVELLKFLNVIKNVKLKKNVCYIVYAISDLLQYRTYANYLCVKVEYSVVRSVKYTTLERLVSEMSSTFQVIRQSIFTLGRVYF